MENRGHSHRTSRVHSPSDIDLAIDALAKAIVAQAVEDYRCILRNRMPTGVNLNFNSQVERKNWLNTERKSIEHFFLSDDLKAFTDIDGQKIIDTLQEEVSARKL